MENTDAIKSHHDLLVWKASMDFVVDIYHATATFPRTEQFALANQIQRAAVSIPSNIAEGHARQSTSDYLHFLSIAQGSLAEVDTQLELAIRLGYLDQGAFDSLQQSATAIGRMLTNLQQSLRKRLAASKPARRPQSPTPNP